MEKKRKGNGGILSRLRTRLLSWFMKNQAHTVGIDCGEEESWINPWLMYSRQVIEQLLLQKGLDYRSFRPILIDTDLPDQIFGEEDDVDQVLSQLEEGLNSLEIRTDRPEHFQERKEYLEEEYGLITRILPKASGEMPHGNMVLDFERMTPVQIQNYPDSMIYLPFQKIPWEEMPGGNDFPEKSDDTCLDIKVPIGYNRLIVRVSKNSRQ